MLSLRCISKMPVCTRGVRDEACTDLLAGDPVGNRTEVFCFFLLSIRLRQLLATPASLLSADIRLKWTLVWKTCPLKQLTFQNLRYEVLLERTSGLAREDWSECCFRGLLPRNRKVAFGWSPHHPQKPISVCYKPHDQSQRKSRGCASAHTRHFITFVLVNGERITTLVLLWVWLSRGPCPCTEWPRPKPKPTLVVRH